MGPVTCSAGELVVNSAAIASRYRVFITARTSAAVCGGKDFINPWTSKREIVSIDLKPIVGPMWHLYADL